MRARIAAFLGALLFSMGALLATSQPASAVFDGYIVTKTNLTSGGVLYGTVDVAMGWSTTGGCHVLADGGPGFPEGIRIKNSSSIPVRVLAVTYRRGISPSPGAPTTLGSSAEVTGDGVTLNRDVLRTVHTGSANWDGLPPTAAIACDQVAYVQTEIYACPGDICRYFTNKNYSPTGISG